MAELADQFAGLYSNPDPEIADLPAPEGGLTLDQQRQLMLAIQSMGPGGSPPEEPSQMARDAGVHQISGKVPLENYYNPQPGPRGPSPSAVFGRLLPPQPITDPTLRALDQQRLAQAYGEPQYGMPNMYELGYQTPSPTDVGAGFGQRAVTGMVNPERFHAAVQNMPLSTNIEDARGERGGELRANWQTDRDVEDSFKQHKMMQRYRGVY